MDDLTGRMNTFLLATTGTGVCLIAYATYFHGAGLSPDSIEYIAIARNILAGSGFTSFDAAPMLNWPPLYPLLLASIARIAGEDPVVVAGPVNAILFGAIVYFSGQVIARVKELSPTLVVGGMLAALISIPLVRVSQMAWSEPLFTVCSLCALYFAIQYWRQQRVRPLLLLSCSIALASLTRYAGIALAVWGCALVAFSLWTTQRRMWAHLSSLLLISTLPVVIWLVRNRIQFGSYMGTRGPAAMSLGANVADAARTVFAWYVPISQAQPLWSRVAWLVAAVVAAALGTRSIGGRVLWRAARRHAPLLVYVLVFSATVLISASITAVDRMDDRLLSPLYIPITLLLLIAVGLIEESKQYVSKTVLQVLLTVGLAAWLLYPLRSSYGAMMHQVVRGLGYANAGWKENTTLRYLQAHPLLKSECSMYSNDPYAIYILTDSVARISPAQTLYNSTQVKDSEESVRQSWPPRKPACLVWFAGVSRDDLYSLERLQGLVELQPIEVLQDGAIFRISGE
ncbi:MAG: glycosyltransferase family 39 protein [Anaerolineales bacterium]